MRLSFWVEEAVCAGWSLLCFGWMGGWVRRTFGEFLEVLVFLFEGEGCC